VSANVQSILVDPRIVYQFEAQLSHYSTNKKSYQFEAQLPYYRTNKKSLTHITNIKELKMEYTIARRKHKVIITLPADTPNAASISLALPKSTTDSILDRNVEKHENDIVITLAFKQQAKASQYIKNFKALQNDNELQTILLNNTPDPKQAAGAKKLPDTTPNKKVVVLPKSTSKQPFPVEEFTIQIHLPKAVKVFRHYPMVEHIGVEGVGHITKNMAEYQGKKLKATFDGKYYVVDQGTKFAENLVTVITEKLMGELVTVAVMSPQNFRGIDVDYIKTNIYGTEVRVHQDLITRHGEVFEIEKLNDKYYEKSTKLPIPVEILNIQTVRS